MTCIVGLKAKDRVIMGGDSAACGGSSLSHRIDPKVFVNGEFLIGFSSSFRMGQILRWEFEPPVQTEDENDEQFIHTRFIEAVRERLKDRGFAEVDRNKETGGVFIFAHRGKLYKVYIDFSIEETVDDFIACGCAEDYALGALRVLHKLPPTERVQLALETAEYFSTDVCSPFVILEMNSNHK